MSTLTSLGLDSEQNLVEYLRNYLSHNPASPLFEVINREFGRIIESNLNATTKAKSKTIVISEKLSVDEQILLSNTVPEYSLVFNNTVFKTHPFASAIRKTEYQLLLDKIGYHPSKATEGFVYAIDIGGDFSYHLISGNFGIHSDCPITCERDDVRYATRIDRVKKYYENKIITQPYIPEGDFTMEHIKNFLQKVSDCGCDNDFYCQSYAQDCTVSARYGIMVHSAYDISLNTLGDIMTKKNIWELHGTIIFSPDIFLNTSGYISGIEAHYSIDQSSDTIEFSFKGCSSFNYKHSFKIYASYFMTSSFYNTAKTSKFLMELMENRSGVQFYKVTRLSAQTPSTAVTHQIWLPTMYNKSIVSYYDIDYDNLAARSGKPTLKLVNAVVDTKLVDKLKSQATAQTETKFKPAELFCFIQAYCGRMFIGSDVVMRHEPISAATARALAYAVYIEVYREKYDSGRILQRILSDIDHDRKLAVGGLFFKLLSSFKTFMLTSGTSAELRRYFSDSKFKRFNRSVFLKVFHGKFWKHSKSELGMAPYIVPADDFIKYTSVNHIKVVRDFLWKRKTPSEKQIISDFFSTSFVVPSDKGRNFFSYNVNALYLDILKQNFGVNVAYTDDTEKISIYRNDVTDRFESVHVPYYLWSMNTASDLKTIPEKYTVFPEFGNLFAPYIAENVNSENFSAVWEEVIRRYKIKFAANNVLFVNYDCDLQNDLKIQDSFIISVVNDNTMFPVVKTSNILYLSNVIKNFSLEFDRFSINKIDYILFDDILAYKSFIDSFSDYISTRTVVLVRIPDLEEFRPIAEYTAGKFSTVDFLQCTIAERVSTVGYMIVSGFTGRVDVNVISSNIDHILHNTVHSYLQNSSIDTTLIDVYDHDSSFVFVDYSIDDAGNRVPYFSDDEAYADNLDDDTDRVYPIPQEIYKACRSQRNSTLLTTLQSIDPTISVHRKINDAPDFDRLIYSFESKVFAEDTTTLMSQLVHLTVGGELVILLPTFSRVGLLSFTAELTSYFASANTYWEHDLSSHTVRGVIRYKNFKRGLTDYSAKFRSQMYTVCKNLDRRRIQFSSITPIPDVLPLSPSVVPDYSIPPVVSERELPSDVPRADFYISSVSSDPGSAPITTTSGYVASTALVSAVDSANENNSVTDYRSIVSTVIPISPAPTIDCPSEIEVPVTADGDCLYHALMGGDDNSVEILKNILSPTGEISGLDDANSVINRFADHYSAHIIVDNGEAKFEFGVSATCLFQSSLVLSQKHYSIRSICDHGAGIVLRHKVFNFNAITLDSVLSVIASKIGKKEVHSLQSDAISNPKVRYYNAIKNFCHNHVYCVNGKFSAALKQAYNRGVRELWVLFDLKNFDTVRFSESVGEFLWEIYTPYWLYAKNYLLVIVRLDTSSIGIPSSLVLQDYSKHMHECNRCRLDQDLLQTVSKRGFFHCLSKVAVVKKVDTPKRANLSIRLASACGQSTNTVVMGAGYLMLFCYSNDGVVTSHGIKEQLALAPADFYTQDITMELNDFHDVSVISHILVNDYAVKTIEYVESPDVFPTPSNMALFIPKLRPVITSKDIILNAMEEVRELHRITEASVISTLSRYHTKVLQARGGLSVWARNHAEFRVPKPDYGMLDLESGEWFYKPFNVSNNGYRYGFDGINLVNISAAFNEKGHIIPGKLKGVYSVSKDSSLLNSKTIYNNMDTYDLDTLELQFDVKLIGGVPGCGKTYEIINQHSFSKTDSKHMVLTSSTETCRDLRRRVAEKYKISADHPILSARYRTVDSLLMHLDKISGDTEVLWFDEGLMRHSGEIFWAAVLTGAKLVNVYGDKCQIPFVNRIAGIKQLLYNDLTKMGDNLSQEFRNTSRRIPADVACYLNAWNVYPVPIKTFNTREKTVRVRRIRTVRDVLTPHYKNFVVLVFTQAEKYDLLAIDPTLKLFTVHEFQGNEAPMILLIRFGKKNDIYSSVNHQLVAISRHTKTFIYATTAGKEDTFAAFLHRDFSNSELQSVVVNLNGGGDLPSFETHPLFILDMQPERMVDILKRQRNIREFVQAHGAFDVVPMRPHFRPVPYITYSATEVAPVPVSNPIQIIQNFYDEVFPGCGYADTSFDSDIFESEEVYFPKAMMSIMDTLGANKRKWDTLSPALRTSCPRVQRQTQKNVLKSFFDRNGAVPEFATLADENLMADQLLEALVSTCIGDRKTFDTFRDHPLTINCESIKDWFKTQPPSVEAMVFADDGYYNAFQRELDLYNYILKVLPKPKLEQFSDLKNPSPQTIAHHCKQINAIFCPIVRELKKRFLAVLRVDKLVFTDSSVENFEEMLNVRLPLDVVERFPNMLEIDISKYDKSQGLIALLFEVQVLKKLGMPEDLLPLWIYMHVFTRLKSQITGVEAYINLQRKSGDAMTFFGNTLFLMAVASNVFTLKDSFCMFSGDDSLVFSRVPFNTVGVAQIMANTYNLEAKFMRFKTPYFCSKHLFVTSDGKWHFVPDIIKLVTKLGRSDLAGFNHVEEYRRSVSDNIKPLHNSLLYDQLSYSIIDRYEVTAVRDFSLLFRAIVTLTQHEETFASLFYQKEGAILAPYEANTPLHEF